MMIRPSQRSKTTYKSTLFLALAPAIEYIQYILPSSSPDKSTSPSRCCIEGRIGSRNSSLSLLSSSSSCLGPLGEKVEAVGLVTLSQPSQRAPPLRLKIYPGVPLHEPASPNQSSSPPNHITSKPVYSTTPSRCYPIAAEAPRHLATPHPLQHRHHVFRRARVSQACLFPIRSRIT